jgi:hypothetical protein
MRDLLFLSHANPEDNEFTLWLAMQLAKEGYKVWCDLTGFLGGEDTWRDIDKLIRECTAKFLYVLSRVSNEKPGALKELQVAENVARDHDFHDFIIPLHIDDLPHRKINIQLARLNAIPFDDGWAKGMKSLFEKLERENTPKNPEITPQVVTSWWREHFSADQGIIHEPEDYLSNWFPIQDMPTEIFFHVLRRTSIGKLGISDDPPFPAFHEGEFLISFAGAEDFRDSLGELLTIERTLRFDLNEFVQGTCEDQIVDRQEARNFVSRLLRIAWENLLRERRLPIYDLSNAQCAYFKKGFAKHEKSFFNGVDGRRTFRQLVGYETMTRGKRFWHFGIQAKPLLYPYTAFVIKPHVVFSDDGQNIWDSPERMHTARRSQCKDWYNPEWRDRMLAAMSQLAGEEGKIKLPIGKDASLEVPNYPLIFKSPVSYVEPQEDAPRVEVDYEEDAEEDAKEDAESQGPVDE